MIWGWGPAGGQGALLTAPGNSIPPSPLAEISLLSREPLFSGASHPHPPCRSSAEDLQVWGHPMPAFWPKEGHAGSHLSF